MAQEPSVNDSPEILMNQLGSNSDDQYVTFQIDTEEYGVRILAVQEIISLPAVTRIPNAPPYIKGLINLRGSIIPLLDLRTKFGLPAQEVGSNTVVIVVQVMKKTVGLIVDKVSDVASFQAENLQDAPDLSAKVESRFIQKMGKIGSRLVILLDIEKVAGHDEILHAAETAKA